MNEFAALRTRGYRFSVTGSPNAISWLAAWSTLQHRGGRLRRGKRTTSRRLPPLLQTGSPQVRFPMAVPSDRDGREREPPAAWKNTSEREGVPNAVSRNLRRQLSERPTCKRLAVGFEDLEVMDAPSIFVR